MRWNSDFFRFIAEHGDADVNKLRLKKNENYSFDLPLAIEQIELKKKVKLKLPDWSKCNEIIYPAAITLEQCSSEITAKYKQSLVKGNSLYDLTGGLGVDTYYFSQIASQVTYLERYSEYCEIARHNFKQLNADNIDVLNEDCRAVLHNIEKSVDTFYIDPARRGQENKRVFALTDCEPDITVLLPLLLEKGSRVIIKASPMVDISHTLSILPAIHEVHIVAVKNECKELLFVIDKENNRQRVDITCANHTGEQWEYFSFTYHEDDADVEFTLTSEDDHFMYEPNVAILKSGGFNRVAHHFSLAKVANNSHLYTSDLWVNNFPGRKFEIIERHPFSGRIISEIIKKIPSASIVCRNFPMKAEEIRHRWKIKENDELFFIFTTSDKGTKWVYVCRRRN